LAEKELAYLISRVDYLLS